MTPWRDLSVKKKLLLISLTSSAAALMLASVAMVAYDQVVTREHMRQDLAVLAAVIGDRSTAALRFEDQNTATQNLAASGAHESIVAGCIYDEDGAVFATYTEAGEHCSAEPPADGSRFERHTLLLVQPIELDGSRIGTVSLRSHLKDLDARLLRYGGITALVVLLATPLALALSARLQRIVSGPIHNLASAAKAVSLRRDYSLRAVKTSGDELGLMVDAFNDMLGTIEKQNLDLVAAKERLEGAVEELGEKNEELERFVYTVSHDLKSPLITINGFLGMLKRDAGAGDTERMERDFRRIHLAVEKMARLLNELLELSRIGRQENSPQAAPLGELADEAVGLLAGSLDERGVKVDVEPDMPVVRGDRPRLLEVFQNLLENAVKFMGDHPEPRVEIGTEPLRAAAGEAVVFVRDNGVGIDPKYHEQVFGLFERLEAETEGTGIGLAIVKRVVEVHGGRIWVESEGAGAGATFYVALPTSDGAGSTVRGDEAQTVSNAGGAS